MELEREPLTSVLGGVLHVCGQADTPLVATFRYLLEDPAAITVDFESHNQQSWRFGRELMREALRKPGVEHGLGDVRTAFYLENEGRSFFRFTLLGVDSKCSVYLDAQAVADFVVQVYDLVPVNADVVDVDALLGEIL